MLRTLLALATVTQIVAAIPKPTVAAITGYALGTGLSLALAADWRVSGDNARLGFTEILAGLVPGGGAMRWGLPRGTRLLIGTLALAALASTGCSGSGDRDGAADSTTALDRLAGRYAHYDVVAYDGDMKTIIISYGFTDYERVGDRLRSHDTFCFSEARTDQPIQITFSAHIAAIAAAVVLALFFHPPKTEPPAKVER